MNIFTAGGARYRACKKHEMITHDRRCMWGVLHMTCTHMIPSTLFKKRQAPSASAFSVLCLVLLDVLLVACCFASLLCPTN